MMGEREPASELTPASVVVGLYATRAFTTVLGFGERACAAIAGGGAAAEVTPERLEQLAEVVRPLEERDAQRAFRRRLKKAATTDGFTELFRDDDQA